jgi:UDP-N-acetylglucosamine 4-epimerase
VNELYADVFARCYGLESIGLRYFNVFGPRQDPNGAYAAVIPKWIDAMLKGETIYINGDGETSRDFCYVANAVQANLLAATTLNPEAVNQVYNVAAGQRTSLNELFTLLNSAIGMHDGSEQSKQCSHGPERAGDVRHSLAAIGKAQNLLGYNPQFEAKERLSAALQWFGA